MREKINEKFLCILKYNEDELIIDYEPIENFFSTEKEIISKLCKIDFDNLSNIIEYLKNTESILQLQKEFKYCEELDYPYQGFTVNITKYLEHIIQKRDLFYMKMREDENYDIIKDVNKLQSEINKDFYLWTSAYNIEKTYRKCFDNKSILTFSHRMNGWSNPEYKLSKNFTLEIKTNFGYGGSSYFYIKLKYKNIEITPFSEWVDYEIAKFSEIIRYTKSFSYKVFKGIYDGKRVYKQIIKNSNWEDAIEFTKIACNISLKNEADFIKKYIINECDRMIIGLENIFSVNNFTFKDEYDKHYEISKTGHQLMEFRGEKLSGALDFINKILEFNEITEIQVFIINIEKYNRKIQPLLVEELEHINLNLDLLNSEIIILKPEYLELEKENQNYIRYKNEIKKQLVDYNELNIEDFDFEKFNKIFLDKFPNYIKFKKNFDDISKKYRTLTENIYNLTKIYKSIETYNIKIINYFGQKI